MKYSFEDHGSTTVLTVSGELTSDQTDGFRRSCLDRFSNGVRDVVFNLEHMTLVDSAGLEVFLWLREATASNHGQLKLVNPDSLVRKILEVTRLDVRFDIHDTIESAAKSLR